MRTLSALLFLIHCNAALAQDTLIQVTLPADTVIVGESFDVTWSMNAIPDETEPPDLKDFIVLFGPKKSTSMSIVNGVTTRHTALTYSLNLLRPGTYTVPVMRARLNGEWSRSPGRVLIAVGDAIPGPETAAVANVPRTIKARLKRKSCKIMISIDGKRVSKCLTPEERDAFLATIATLMK